MNQQGRYKIGAQLRQSVSRHKRSAESQDKYTLNTQSSERYSPRREVPRTNSTKQLLTSIQEENRRLQQQVTRNGSVINRLIETLRKKELGTDMQVVIKQVQDELDQRQYYLNRGPRRAAIKVNPLLEPTSTQIPHSVGEVRQTKLLKPRILKTGTDRKNSLFTQSGSNSLCNLYNHFRDLNHFQSVQQTDLPFDEPRAMQHSYLGLHSEPPSSRFNGKQESLPSIVPKQPPHNFSMHNLDALGNMTFMKEGKMNQTKEHFMNQLKKTQGKMNMGGMGKENMGEMGQVNMGEMGKMNMGGLGPQEKSKLVKKYRASLNRFPAEVFSSGRGKQQINQ